MWSASISFLFLLCCCPLLQALQVLAGGQADDCTSGFMSLDRMNAVLNNYGGDIEKCDVDGLVLLVSMNFTCDGVISEIIVGADWERNHGSSIALQIWRPASGNEELYILVESTTVFITEENETELYHYPLSSPLSFQAGDVIGYYQTNDRRLTFLYEETDLNDYPLYYITDHDNAQTTVDIQRTQSDHQYHLLFDVVTDSPGCACGFMSVERMKILLGLDRVGFSIRTHSRQQLTPGIKFTCNGMITKWIIGADRNSLGVYPELQIWRATGVDTYEKVNGTNTANSIIEQNRIFTFSDFAPIPFEAGDVLGMYMPFDSIIPRAEHGGSYTNYYVSIIEFDPTSPYHTMDVQQSYMYTSVYRPLVSVEIVEQSHEPATSTLFTIVLPSVTPSAEPSVPIDPPTKEGGSSNKLTNELLYIVLGTSGLVVVTTLVVVSSLSMCLKRRKTKTKPVISTSENVAYAINEPQQLPPSFNDSDSLKDSGASPYDYASTSNNNTREKHGRFITFPNEAYAVTVDDQTASETEGWATTVAN